MSSILENSYGFCGNKFTMIGAMFCWRTRRSLLGNPSLSILAERERECVEDIDEWLEAKAEKGKFPH
ncbi:hypothetical protein MANES_05G172201v8 [Manihot esculenta]|uniref:Uncharacterized protein n=1 Tax=Manihot esculenta TaxID=3983 RepID=A0ACB7HVA5_MANES|nr:hypothetical protein MANES_05G172201v8 [Manihot esculenta]